MTSVHSIKHTGDCSPAALTACVLPVARRKAWETYLKLHTPNECARPLSFSTTIAFSLSHTPEEEVFVENWCYDGTLAISSHGYHETEMVSYTPSSGRLPVVHISAAGKIEVTDRKSRLAVLECLRGAFGSTNARHEFRFPRLRGRPQYQRTPSGLLYTCKVRPDPKNETVVGGHEEVSDNGTVVLEIHTLTTRFR